MAMQRTTDVDSRLEVYLTHRSALVDYAVPLLGSRAWAEDVVQEAFLRFVSSASSDFKPVIHPVAYLYRIVHNLAMDWGRHNALARLSDDGDEDLAALPAPAPSPEQQAIDRDELRIVAEALAELPARTQAAFRMHRLAGLSLQQIAGELGISVTLVHQLIHKALTHCADRLDALGE